MHRLDAGVEPQLLGGVDLGLRCAAPLALGDERRELGIFRGRGLRQRMIGRDRHELGAEQGVVAGGEDLELVLAVRRGLRVEREAYVQALGAADPVLLHQPHLLRPARQRIERVKQLLRIAGDLEHPLFAGAA